MNNNNSQVTDTLKKVRLALMKVERAFNTADQALLWSMCRPETVIIHRQVPVRTTHPFPLNLFSLFAVSEDAVAYCTLVINEVLLLTPHLAYGDIVLHLHRVSEEAPVVDARQLVVVLIRDLNESEWQFLLARSLT